MQAILQLNNNGTLYSYPKLNPLVIPQNYPSEMSYSFNTLEDAKSLYKNEGNYYSLFFNTPRYTETIIAQNGYNRISAYTMGAKGTSWNGQLEYQEFRLQFYLNNNLQFNSASIEFSKSISNDVFAHHDIFFIIDDVEEIAIPCQVFVTFNQYGVSNGGFISTLKKSNNANFTTSELHTIYTIITQIGFIEDFDYNYTPINYITGNNKTLKLSMIKAESTNHGESVSDGLLSDIQRFTDNSDLFSIGKNLAVDDEIILGYTAQNNYVTFKRTYLADPTRVGGELHYYQNGVELSGLAQTNLPSMYDTGSTYSKVYFSLLLDIEHSACRPSLIWVWKATLASEVDYVYNSFENDASISTDANQSLWLEWLANGYYTESVDPYDYGGESEPDSGDGQWDNSSENIDIPTIPSVSISDTGFVSVFNPTLAQVKALADYMWSGAFDVSLFKKVMANPMDSIIGFALIPCEPSVSGVDTVKVGNIDTGVSMNAVSNQFVDVDCGSLALQEYWGNYLDYAPYTKITLVLPFIGAVHLSPDDCMKKTIGIKYRIDILSGGCVAYITCNGSVLYQFTGSCSAQLPITNLDYRGMISALVSIGTTAVGVGSAIASGGITAPMVAVGVGNTANNVMNGKPTIQHGGSLGSTSGFLGTRIPYLIITRPRQCVPTNVNKFKGLPSLITSKLKNVTGFTQVHDIHLDDLPCSDEEKLELKGLLESGVII